MQDVVSVGAQDVVSVGAQHAVSVGCSRHSEHNPRERIPLSFSWLEGTLSGLFSGKENTPNRHFPQIGTFPARVTQ